MICEKNFFVGLRDINSKKKLSDEGILGILEDIGSIHGNTVGYGIADMERTRLSWVVLHWKVDIVNRPVYAQTIKVKTWLRKIDKVYFYRDYQIEDLEGNTLIRAASQWALISIDNGRIFRPTPDIIELFKVENMNVFANDPEMDKLHESEKYDDVKDFIVPREYIDVNKHMNNIYYIDVAYEVLPEDVYFNREFKYFEISYRKQITLGEKLKCYYSFEGTTHTVTIKSEDDSKLHSVIIMKE